MLLHVDPNNFDEAIKLYAISLQADISLNLKATKQYTSNFKQKNYIEPTSRKENIIKK